MKTSASISLKRPVSPHAETQLCSENGALELGAPLIEWLTALRRKSFIYNRSMMGDNFERGLANLKAVGADRTVAGRPQDG